MKVAIYCSIRCRVAASRARKQLRAENNAEFEFVAQPDICRHCARNYKQQETIAVLQETIAKLETSLAAANSEPGRQQGNRISREERMILNVRLFDGKRLGDELTECYRAQMSDAEEGKWIEIAGVCLIPTGKDSAMRKWASSTVTSSTPKFWQSRRSAALQKLGNNHE